MQFLFSKQEDDVAVVVVFFSLIRDGCNTVKYVVYVLSCFFPNARIYAFGVLSAYSWGSYHRQVTLMLLMNSQSSKLHSLKIQMLFRISDDPGCSRGVVVRTPSLLATLRNPSGFYKSPR